MQKNPLTIEVGGFFSSSKVLFFNSWFYNTISIQITRKATFKDFLEAFLIEATYFKGYN